MIAYDACRFTACFEHAAWREVHAAPLAGAPIAKVAATLRQSLARDARPRATLSPFRNFVRSMRVISLNVNGIRAAENKGLSRWLKTKAGPWDVLCVQELKAQHGDMTEEFLSPGGYHGHFHYAEKTG